MNNFEDRANPVLTDPHPSSSDGQPIGSPEEVRQSGQGGLKADPPPLSPAASSAPDSAASDARKLETSPVRPELLAGIPDALPPTWCPNCKADVLPKGKGKCPRCGRTLRGSFLNRRHPVNLAQREVLEQKLGVEFEPITMIERATVARLAAIMEQLETMRPGSPEHQRLVQLEQQLGRELEERRDARRKAQDADLASMTKAEMIAHLEQTLADLKREAEQTVAASEVHDEAEQLAEAVAQVEQQQPSCRFCYQPGAACDALKESDLATWRALHSLHPDEVKRRDEEATSEMMASMRRRTEPQPW